MSCTKGECPCGTSSDAFATYDDGGTYCFRCENKNVPKDFKGAARAKPDDTPEEEGNWTPLQGWTEALIARGISEKTCKKFSYQIGKDRFGNRVHIQNIKGARGELRGQKLRTKDKDFPFFGPAAKDPGIIGSWLWPTHGKRVCITEGEIDMMSYCEAFDGKYCWGSLPNGTGSVEKAILRDYEKLCAFDEIYLSFDDDEPGQKALKKACELLPVGKVKIISLPKNDANAVLMDRAFGPAVLVRAFWDAKTYRPDGIREGREFTRERLKTKKQKGFSLPWPKLNEMWMGLRAAEITTIIAGSGVGKTTIARDIAYHMRVEHGLKIGNIYLEEDNDTSVKAYVGLHAGVPLKRLIADPDGLSDDKWDAALAAVIHDGMLFYDHFGSLESDRLLNMMRYMAASGCKFVVLDHISIVTSGLESSSEGERKDIDVLMTKLASFVKETGCGVIAIVHLKRTQGKNFNEGSKISCSDMRGSASLEQLSFNILAAERNQQDELQKLYAQLRSLKCRITGETGEADKLKWNVAKGCYEIASDFDAASEFDPHETPNTEDTKF